MSAGSSEIWPMDAKYVRAKINGGSAMIVSRAPIGPPNS
jgi:hypothetical protein